MQVAIAGRRPADASPSGPSSNTVKLCKEPPFNGSQHLRRALGDEYVEALKKTFKVGVKDLCTYWFRRTQDHLAAGQRTGLVGTNSISQNRGRSASLDYVIKNSGVITDAVSSQKWPGDAKVHVSLVNWINAPYDGPFTLDGVSVEGIDSSLRSADLDAFTAQRLPTNAGRCFQGPIPVGAGFIISDDEAHALLARTDADYSNVVRRYLVGEDIADDPAQAPTRWIIDFGLRTLEHASKYPAALNIVRDRVKPERDGNAQPGRRQRWWLFGSTAKNMRKALVPLDRYAAAARIGKRLLLTWVTTDTSPSDITIVFAFDDDFSMGVLQSRAHIAWAWHQASTLKGDLRYTPTSVFMTFPWPNTATNTQKDTVAAASQALLQRRNQICTSEQIGLTELYNQVDDGAYTDLKQLHQTLDQAVTACYGWPKPIAQTDAELVRRLIDRNKAIHTGKTRYEPFGER